MNKKLSAQIKSLAKDIGFDACGICRAESIGAVHTSHLREWLDNSYQAGMDYMSGHFEKRCDPTLLVEGAKSVISLALNYYPEKKQPEDAPQFAYYTYGKDYHFVMKEKLQQLFDAIKELIPSVEGRIFCDSAPVMERYWAAKSGIGFIGKNSLLIIPKKGSYFFIGELIINIDLDYDKPLNLSCGSCSRCMDFCPTKAIVEACKIDSNRCISYQTIENKGEISTHLVNCMHNRLYGCDICQQVCPWNRFAHPNETPEFSPSIDFLSLDVLKLTNMNEDEYRRVFKNSAVKRAKFTGLKRNLEALKGTIKNKKQYE